MITEDEAAKAYLRGVAETEGHKPADIDSDGLEAQRSNLEAHKQSVAFDEAQGTIRDLHNAIHDLHKALARLNPQDPTDIVTRIGQLEAKLVGEGKPRLPEKVEIRFNPQGGVRFYVASRVWYDAPPSTDVDDLKSKIDVVYEGTRRFRG